MKKVLLPIAAAACAMVMFTMTSCGNSAGDNADSAKHDSASSTGAEKPKFEDVCKEANSTSVTIKGYNFQMSGKYEFAGAFDVKQSSVTMINDSTAKIKLSNYTAAELVGDRKDNQVDINVELFAKNGKKIGPGTYIKGSEGDMRCSITMMTAKGTVWFNWLAGMPEAGSVTLNYIDDKKACGTFALSAEKPDNEMIGTVRLNGAFKAGE